MIPGILALYRCPKFGGDYHSLAVGWRLVGVVVAAWEWRQAHRRIGGAQLVNDGGSRRDLTASPLVTVSALLG